MEAIVNELSLEGQFVTLDDFINNLSTEMDPILKQCNSLKIIVLKKMDIYNYMVTNEENLFHIIQIQGVPSITRFKSLLANIINCPPFWDSDSKICLHSEYKSIYSDNKMICLYEAYERGASLISFNHTSFKEDINIKKNDVYCTVKNNNTYIKFLKYIYDENLLTSFEYLKISTENIDFVRTSNSIYVKEFIDNSNFDKNDKDTIVDDIKRMLELKERNDPLGRFSKYLGRKIYEFRTTIQNFGEIRVLYFQYNGKFVFTHGFIKTTPATPPNEIDLAIAYMNSYISNQATKS